MNEFVFKITGTDGVKKEIAVKSRSTTLNINLFNNVKESFPENVMNGTLFIPEGIKTIDNIAITEKCGDVKTICLPSSIQKIYRHAFYFPLSIEKIFAHKDNQYFSSDANGVLFNKDKTTLVRYPIGKNEDYYEIPPSVNEIAPFAFAQSKIKYLIVPPSVKIIGEQAFQNSQLASVDFTESKIESLPKECFWLCDNLITVKLPKHLKSIAAKCFCRCGFENIELPDSLVKIEKYAFLSSNLKTISMPRDLKVITGGVFQDCEQLENINISNVTKIHKTAFTGCTALSEITANIHNRSFYTRDGILYDKSRKKLLKVPPAKAFMDGIFNIPDSVEVIDEAAIDSCDNIFELYINANVEDSAIFNCRNLRKIVIGADCEHITAESIKLCFSVSEISVHINNPYYKSINSVLFDNTSEKLILYPPAKKADIYALPDGIKEIDSYAFYYSRISEVRLPDSVVKIDPHAFEHSSLTSINLGKVENIDTFAFISCEQLNGISLNDCRIGNYAFAFCSELNGKKQNNCVVGTNTFVFTPVNNNSLNFSKYDRDEMEKASLIAHTPPDFLCYPRIYKENYWC